MLIKKLYFKFKCPSADEWIKMWCVCVHIYVHNGILLNVKKNEIMPFAATWMDLEIIILSEVRERQILIYHLCVESKI